MKLNEIRASRLLTYMEQGKGTGNMFICPCVFAKVAKEKYLYIFFPKWILPINANSDLTNLDPLLKGYIKCIHKRIYKNLRKTVVKSKGGTSMVVQWLRLCTPNSGGLGSIPGW